MNKDAAIAQANLNRIDQHTPQGSLTYQQIGTNSDGTPRYSQTQTLSADEQAKYDQANKVALALGGLAGDNISRVQDVQSKPFNFDGMTDLRTSIGQNIPGVNFGSGANPNNVQGSLDYSGLTKLPGTDDFSADAQRVASSVYGQATSRLDPQFQQRESDTRARLAAQGISENSDAFRREMDNFGRDRTDAYNQANFAATQAGANEQSRLFGLALGARQQGQNEVNTQGDFANSAAGQQFQQALAAAGFGNQAQAQAFNQDAAAAAFQNQGRQQQINEASYLRNLPLNEIAALLSGSSVNNPQFQNVSQVGVAAPDYQGGVWNQFDAQQRQYEQAQANRSAGLGSIFGTLGSVAGLALSDRRVKRDIKRIGTLPNGLPTYAFKYVNDNVQRFGVMAQDALKIIPEAVGRLASGILYVNYAKVY